MLKEIKLNFDGTFEEREIEVLDKTKQGEITGKDDKGKPIYNRIPSVIWKTADGNFDSKNLDIVKVAGDYFYIKTENTSEFARKLLKDYAITHFETMASTIVGRIKTLQQNIQEQEDKLKTVDKRLKIAKETK